jgi:serine/threonine protein kinase/Tol biopolymer transport system component
VGFRQSEDIVRFEQFELNVRNAELHGPNGKTVRLSEQPLRILVALLEQPGEVVLREDLRKRLWPNDTIVEFEHSINAAVNKLRQVLGDSANTPKFIETLARRGYRWKTPVKWETPAVPTPPKSPGDSLIGKKILHYRVLEVLGGGGMGVVYKAEDIKLGRRVALKFLPEELATDPAARQRFEREARAASALNHPNICTIYAVEECEGRTFIAMEFLEGQTLRDLIAQEADSQVKDTFQLKPFLDIALQITKKLDTAHQKSITHRDIKPANIFITKHGLVKILDFGLAKLQELDPVARPSQTLGKPDPKQEWNASLTLTHPGVTLGTAAYMSPEQVRGEPLDARTDLFSFGLVLYEMATRHRTFLGDTAEVLYDSILNQTPVRVRELNAQVPPKLENIISRSMEKDRGARYENAAELLSDLRELELDSDPRLLSRASGIGLGAGAGPTRKAWARLGFALVVLGAIAWSAYTYIAPKSPPFRHFEITQVTGIGKVKTAAISSDGRYLAYVVDDGSANPFFELSAGGKQSLWVRQVAGGNDVQVAPAANVDYKQLKFSRDGGFLYVIRSQEQNPASSLYSVPVLGGTEKRLISNLDDVLTLSPDGRQMAFVRFLGAGHSNLVIANEDGGGERILADCKSPPYFCANGVAWSPNGRAIVTNAFWGESSTGRMSPLEFSVQRGSAHSLTNQRWAWVGNLAWLPDGRGLIANAMDLTSTHQHIGYLSYADGQLRRITTDTNDYRGVSLTADSRTLATVQQKLSFDAWVLPASNAENARPITSGGTSGETTWSPDGKIVFQKIMGQGEMNIFMMESDGSNAKQLTAKAGRINVLPRVSPDGRYIVFVSERTGTAHLWRMDIDGRNPKQVTNSAQDYSWFGFDFTPDSKWIVYTRTGSEAGLWKVSIEGGESSGLSTSLVAYYPAVSPDGKMVAYYYEDSSGRKGVDVMQLNSNAPDRQFDIPMGTIRWVPNGRALLYVKNEGDVSNLWSQPISGEPPNQITHFNSLLISQFDLSQDGKELVMSRGTANRDVVLIRDLR